jgi:hypothetical protein
MFYFIPNHALQSQFEILDLGVEDLVGQQQIPSSARYTSGGQAGSRPAHGRSAAHMWEYMERTPAGVASSTWFMRQRARLAGVATFTRSGSGDSMLAGRGCDLPDFAGSLENFRARRVWGDQVSGGLIGPEREILLEIAMAWDSRRPRIHT